MRGNPSPLRNHLRHTLFAPMPKPRQDILQPEDDYTWFPEIDYEFELPVGPSPVELNEPNRRAPVTYWKTMTMNFSSDRITATYLWVMIPDEEGTVTGRIRSPGSEVIRDYTTEAVAVEEGEVVEVEVRWAPSPHAW